MKINDLHDSVAREIRDLIDLEGGPPGPETVGAVLRNESLPKAAARILQLQDILNEVSRANHGPEVSIHMTRSTSMRTGVHRVGTAHAAVLVPIGLIARIQVMHRLLLSEWNREGQPQRFLVSIMDRPHDRWVPPRLKPLLSDLDEESDWWSALNQLDAATSFDAAFAPDVIELNALTLSLVMCHEIAHVLRHHHEVVRKVMSKEFLFEVGDGNGRRPATKPELHRAKENEADMIAAYLAVLILVRQAPSDRLQVGFLRLGYALTAMLALFHPRQLSLFDYLEGSEYPHPFVRYGAYMLDTESCATQAGVDDAYERGTDIGARKCFDALGWIETDIFTKGRFGGIGRGPDFDPTIHPLRATDTFRLTLFKEQEKQRALALRLGTLITQMYGELQLPQM